MITKWFAMTPEQIAKRYGSDTTSGLSRDAARVRREKRGGNEIYPIPRSSFRDYLKKLSADFTSLLLIGTALLALIFDQQVSAAVLIALVVLNTVFCVVTYVRSHGILEAMGIDAQPNAKVIRDGKLYIIRQDMLVPGDVIILSAGDVVPADARLISSDGLTVSDVNLTGSREIKRKMPTPLVAVDLHFSDQVNMVFASSVVMSGAAKAIVCCTGEDTRICRMKLNHTLVSHDNLTPLKSLKKYCRLWSLCMIALVAVLLVVDLLTGGENRTMFDMLLTGLTLAVASMSELYTVFAYAAVAQGLYGAGHGRAAGRNRKGGGALIKNVEALDKLSALRCLIVPKEMLVEQSGIRVAAVGCGEFTLTPDEKLYIRNSAPILRLAVVSTGLYGGKRLLSNNMKSSNIYSAEEEAIITAAEDAKLYNVMLERNYPLLEHAAVSVSNRFETSLFCDRSEGGDGSLIAVIRGDAKSVLARCTAERKNGELLPLTDDRRAELEIEFSRVAHTGLRVCAIATKPSVYNNLRRIGACQSGMTYEGFVAFLEPVLPGAAKNIIRCREAGIRILLTTPDVSENNVNLAISLGIIADESGSVTGREIASMRDGLFRANIPLYGLYQGLDAQQKTALENYLRSDAGQVGSVALTLSEFDFLKNSDVGFAAGLLPVSGKTPMINKTADASGQASGSCEILRFASDVIISDPDKAGRGGFNAMVSAISFAGVIYRNIGRILRYLVISQTARFLVTLFGVISGMILLSPVQILFSGLVTDFAAVIITVFEKPRGVGKDGGVGDGLKKTLAAPFKNGWKDLLTGAFWAAAVILLCGVVPMASAVPAAVRASGAFLSMILCSFAALTQVLHEDGIFRSGLRVSAAAVITVVGLALFCAVSLLFGGFGTLFGILPMGGLIAGMILLCGAAVFLSFDAARLFASLYAKKKEKEKQKKKEKEDEAKKRASAADSVFAETLIEQIGADPDPDSAPNPDSDTDTDKKPSGKRDPETADDEIGYAELPPEILELLRQSSENETEENADAGDDPSGGEPDFGGTPDSGCEPEESELPGEAIQSYGSDDYEKSL